jgi:hypothetical protein
VPGNPLADPRRFIPGVLAVADTEQDAAREVFASAMAGAYHIPVRKITVQPVHAGLPDNPYDRLKTGALFAVRADWPGNDPGPAGFAAADGCTAFARHPDGVRALLEACRISDPKMSLPLDDIIKRLAWIYRHAGEPAEIPHRRTEIQRSADGIKVIYQTRSPGGTGSLFYSEVEVFLPPSGPATFHITKIPAPIP